MNSEKLDIKLLIHYSLSHSHTPKTVNSGFGKFINDFRVCFFNIKFLSSAVDIQTSFKKKLMESNKNNMKYNS